MLFPAPHDSFLSLSLWLTHTQTHLLVRLSLSLQDERLQDDDGYCGLLPAFCMHFIFTARCTLRAFYVGHRHRHGVCNSFLTSTSIETERRLLAVAGAGVSHKHQLTRQAPKVPQGQSPKTLVANRGNSKVIWRSSGLIRFSTFGAHVRQGSLVCFHRIRFKFSGELATALGAIAISLSRTRGKKEKEQNKGNKVEKEKED